MRYHAKKISSIALILLLIHPNTHTMKPQEVLIDSDWGTTSTDSDSTSTTDSEPTPPTSTIPLNDSFTVQGRDYDVRYERYFNYETQEFGFNRTIIQHEPNPFDVNLPQYQTDTLEQTSSSQQLNTQSPEYDYFSDFAGEQRQQVIKEAEENQLEERQKENTPGLNQGMPKDTHIIREQDFPQGKKLYLGDRRKFDSDIILDKAYTNIQNVLNHPIVQARFARLIRDFENKPVKHGRWGKEHNSKSELKFLNASRSGEIAALLGHIQTADLATKISAFNKLQDLWPYKRDHTFLIPSLEHGTGETGFTQILGIEMLKIVERDLITCPDYIQAHMNEESCAIIQNLKEKCADLQKKNDVKALFDLKQKTFQLVLENGKQTNLLDNICLAIVEKAYLDPINIVLGRIKHAPSLEAAHKELQNLEMQLLQHANDRNITRMSDLKEKAVQQYEFDLLQIAHELYRARPDYVHTGQNQSFLSNSLAPILANIKYQTLPVAHAELMHVQKQITNGLKARNITDSAKQKERIKKDFGGDVLQLIHQTYTERPDYINVVDFFIPLDVQKITAEILQNNYDYSSVANEFNKVAEQVLDNAKLCELDVASELEKCIYDSLHVMRAPKNNVEFIFHASAVDHLLTDLQCQADAIATATPTAWQTSSELFNIAITEFIHGANPIELVKDVGSVFLGVGYVGVKIIGRAIEEIRDPIGTTKEYCAIVSQTCHYIADVARFTSDTVHGTSFLPKDVYEKRFDAFCKTLEAIDNEFTAKNIVAVTCRTVGSFVGSAGINTACTSLKQMGVFTRISDEIKVLIQPIVDAIKKSPAFVTAEGIVLKMSHGTKNTGSGNAAKAIHLPIIDSVFLHKLKSAGDNIWQSPAGIIYGDDRKFGNTLNHMLAHMTPNPTKKVHTVFSVPKNKIVELIDEAWLLKGNPLALDPCAYLIDMKRIIGTQGETFIRVIVKEPGSCELLTAYPVTI